MHNEILTQSLLDWYDKNGRDLPWRQKGGAHPNPYQVWISEIMLQQTTVKTVIPYFERWLQKFPTIDSVADADEKDVLLMWQGLGYYTRAKKIYECAKVLKERYQSRFPDSREALLKLPGIGPYTASSLSAFAFNKPETVVDGNVIRVISRLYGIETPVTIKEIFPLAEQLTSQTRGADYASAIMDLGAVVCTPTKPACLLCPFRTECVAHQKNLTDKIPLIIKPEKLNKKGNLFYIRNKKGEVYLQTRAGKGLLSGLTEFPWNEDASFPFDGDFQKMGKIAHTFTHFHLELDCYFLEKETLPFPNGKFVHPTDFEKYPFSTLMKKAVRLAEKYFKKG